MRSSLVVLAAVCVAGCNAATPPAPKVETDDQKTFYALGYAMSEGVKTFELTPEELELLKVGFTDGVNAKKAVVEPEEFFPKIRELQTKRMAAAALKRTEAGDQFIAKVAAEPGAQKLESGVVLVTMKEGTGPTPTATDNVKVHYHGTLTDGTVFDSSVERKEPVTFRLNEVIPCWTEGVQKIKTGGKSKLVCPSDTAYGERGSPPTIQPGATLVFEVELLEVTK